MSVVEAIKNRNSNPFMTEQDVDPEIIGKILDAAVCTPVHYRTNPWRFLVIRGEGRKRFGDFMARRMQKDMENPDSPENKEILDKMRQKPFRAPVIIVAAAGTSEIPKAVMKENVASVAAACQNILLAADEFGLNAIWRTGSMTYEEDTVEFLGFAPGTELLGFIYLGYCAKETPPKRRETSEVFTLWMED